MWVPGAFELPVAAAAAAGTRALRLPGGARRGDPGRDAALRVRGRRDGARAQRRSPCSTRCRSAFGVLTVDTLEQAVDAGRRRARATRGTRRRPRRSSWPTCIAPAPGAPMLRTETKSRARALQLLYAWELQGAPPMHDVATGLARLTGPEPRSSIAPRRWRRGDRATVEALDARGRAGADNWRLEPDRRGGAEHPPARHPRAAARRRAAQGGDRRGGPAGALVRRRARAGAS